VQDFIDTFLQKTDSGSRLVGIWGAIMSLVSENGTVSANPPNVSDKYGKKAGDVEIYYNKELVAASECKHRPLNLDDVKHGIKKALDKKVPELHFITAAGLSKGQEKLIRKELDAYSNEIDLLLVDIWSTRQLLAGILNPIRRAKFGETVVNLMNTMRRFESANQAADIWNKLTS